MRERVGFVGLGVMGLRMLENLLGDEALEIHAYDTSEEPFRRLERHDAWGVRLFRAADVAALAQCRKTILMLPNSRVTNEVVLGAGERTGLGAVLASGADIIDMGSSNPLETRRLAELLAGRGVHLTDAPVSGAVVKASNGTLTIMVGAAADSPTFDRLRPLLSRMGTTLLPAGGVGAAHAMKALNNYVYAAGLLAVSEAELIARRLGLDSQCFARVLNASSGRNVASETKLEPFILTGRYADGFALRLQAKDLAIADALRVESGACAEQLAHCCALWSDALEAMPDAANTAIHLYLKGKSDVVDKNP